jgi:alginate O-acetyltransferase complex protein AlgI
MTMLLGGLWHGAAWTFVVWGFLHGLFLVVERLIKNVIRIQVKNAVMGLLLALLTFTCVNVTCVFFRATYFKTAMNLLGSMIFVHGTKRILMSNHVVLVGLLMTFVFLGHYMMRSKSLVGIIEASPKWILIGAWGVMFFGLMIVQTSGQQFIYFQF